MPSLHGIGRGGSTFDPRLMMGLAPLDLGRRRSFEIPSVFPRSSISVNSSWDSVEGGGRKEEGGRRKEEGGGRREEGGRQMEMRD